MSKLFILLAMLITLAAPAFANPFTDGKPAPANAAAASLFQTPFMHEVMQIQRQIHEAMTDSISALKQGQSHDALWILLLISFAYGVFHVLAPGHGKVIVASYFIGNHARWREGVWAGLIMAVGHTITAVAIVVVLYFVFAQSQFHVLAQARYLELGGYGMIAAIGLWMLLRSFKKTGGGCAGCGQTHAHDHTHHMPAAPNAKGGMSLFAATSLVPCTGSMIILLFTVANDILWAGILAVIAIALGMWLMVTIIGLGSILLRRSLLGSSEGLSEGRKNMMKLVSIIAALIVTATGGLLFIGTLHSVLV